MVKGYCMKEKKKNVEILNPQYEMNARGGAVAVGKCGSCGNKIYAFIKSANAPPELRAKIEKFRASKAKKGGSRKSKSANSKKSKASKKSKKSNADKPKKSRKSKKSRRSRK